MARRAGNTAKCVDEKRRQLPIYQHYFLSPGKTKSHHPEAKCVHCHKEFVCGSKQRLIRHIRKCNSISNAEQIIAETLNILARNSATGQLNHSILEASNLLPSQISHIQHSATQQLVGQAIQQQQQHQNTSSNNNNTTIIGAASGSLANNGHNNTTGGGGGSGGDTLSAAPTATTSYNVTSSLNTDTTTPAKKPQKRGRKPTNQAAVGPGIHVTTGMDGKTHFSPANQLPQASGCQLITQAGHNARPGQSNYNPYQVAVGNNNSGTIVAGGGGIISTSAGQANTIGGAAAGSNNALASGHLPCVVTQNQHHHHHSSPFKLNTELIDKSFLRLVLTRNLPLSLCDTKEFHAWIKTFANEYKPPSSINLLEQNLKHEAQSARQRVSNIIIKTSKKTINLELHSLIDEIRGHSWYAMIATVDHRRFLISVQDLTSRMMKSSSSSSSSLTTSSSNALANNQTTSAAVSFSPEKHLKLFIDDCIKRVGSDRVNSLLLTGKLKTDDSIVARACQSLYATHPSIVTYHCWWHYTNLLCADTIACNEVFMGVMRNSNLLIDFINKRPQLSSGIEKFSPFIGALGTLDRKRDDYRWYSHLVCYLFEYLKNNQEAIKRNLEEYLASMKLSSDNNNNNNTNSNDSLATGSNNNNNNTHQNAQQNSHLGTQETLTTTTAAAATLIFCQQDSQLVKVKYIVTSDEYWANLKSALVYLKPFRDVVALAQNMTNINNNNTTANNNNNGTDSQNHQQQETPAISNVTCNNLPLGDYMNWFLKYGKTLFDCWKESSDNYKYHLIGNFLKRFNSSMNDFKLVFAAYLLNPKHRCAYMTQKAKDCAIEEILNIASEFMPEESDGHTIFDQWKLYLKREQPYDTIFDENRSTALEWWMSLPCAESIRRVALRILRLKAFSSPKPETVFSQLYFYEDENRLNLNETTFEDMAILRYFYDHEDKIGQPNYYHHGGSSSHNSNATLNNVINNSAITNGFGDRTLVGQVHNEYVHKSSDPVRLLPDGPLDSLTTTTTGTANNSLDDSGLSGTTIKHNEYGSQYSDVIESTLIDHNRLHMSVDDNSSGMNHNNSLNLESLPNYNQFREYIDFDDTGVRIVEEPAEKKRRKWTAQEILSKCQSNNNGSTTANNNNNNSNHAIDSK